MPGKYRVRLNPKNFNPLTGKAGALPWEVEQVADKDSPRVIWHCASVCIGHTPVTLGGNDFVEFYGVIFTDGRTNAIVIQERKP